MLKSSSIQFLQPMGQCCLIFAKTQPNQPNKATQLLTKTQLAIQYHTRNDKQFTYYLGVYNLLTLGQKLQSPEYMDQLHPNFSYHTFSDCYAQYQREIKQLGKYIEKYNDKESPLAKRVEKDRVNIESFKRNNKIANNQSGCMVKMELQEVRWTGVKEIILQVIHPMNWPNKFERTYKVDEIQLSPIYLEFCIPLYKEAIVEISGKEVRGQIQIKVEQCINNDQLVLCKIMKWRGASNIQGIALRVQIVNQQQQGQKLKITQMSQLFHRLNQDYRADEIEASLSEKDISQKLSRHHKSVEQKNRMSSSRRQ